MKKALSLILLLIITFLINIQYVKADDWYQDSIGNWHNESYESLLDESYYASLDGIVEKDEFYLELHDIISHKLDGNNPTNQSELYTDEIVLEVKNIHVI